MFALVQLPLSHFNRDRRTGVVDQLRPVAAAGVHALHG